MIRPQRSVDEDFCNSGGITARVHSPTEFGTAPQGVTDMVQLMQLTSELVTHSCPRVAGSHTADPASAIARAPCQRPALSNWQMAIGNRRGDVTADVTPANMAGGDH